VNRYSRGFRDFTASISSLLLRARLRELIKGSHTGLFYGLLAAALVSAVLGTVSLEVPALLAPWHFHGLVLAGLLAVSGAMVGAIIALIRRADVRRILRKVDRALGSRELVCTAYELSMRSEAGFFSAAIIEEAERLLRTVEPRRALGRSRLPFLPFIPILTAAVVLMGFFPVNLSKLFGSRTRPVTDFAFLGNELEDYGRRLEETAGSHNLPRSLALARELARIGKELADNGVRTDDALEKLSNLERRLAYEYDSRTRNRFGKEGNATLRDLAEGEDAWQELKDLGDALSMLREKARKAIPRDRTGSGEKDAQSPPGEELSEKERTRTNPPEYGGEGSRGQAGKVPGGGGGSRGNSATRGKGSGQDQKDTVRGGAGGREKEKGAGSSSAAGTIPDPEKKGKPSEIARGGSGERLPAEARVSEGESARLLARALPGWTGSKLSEERVLREYARRAESAIAKEEVPPKLREYVKNYFTNIGLEAGDQ
jgi:hypothetical protein